jgi:phage shock protein PspC (stress-responsive transcriptional regulator)
MAGNLEGLASYFNIPRIFTGVVVTLFCIAITGGK